MNKDFTFPTYNRLINTLKKLAYKFVTFEEYLNNSNNYHKIVILRHDVDRKPENAFKMAKIENDFDIRSSYYFRIVKESYNEKIIKKIVEFNHELGYHYEDIALCNGNYKMAINRFEENLNLFQKYYPVKTICMHGSPMSRWDNRMLWRFYQYKDFGIIGEPYFDLNYNDILYLTDSSRRWNSDKFTLRDRVDTIFNIKPKSTFEIIEMLNTNCLPNQIMINIHPHNWSETNSEWIKTYLWQGLKNEVKRFYAH